MRPHIAWGIGLAIQSMLGTAWGAEAVNGVMVTAGLTGREVQPHHWIEQRIFVGSLNDSFGAGVLTAHTPRGVFSISGKGKPSEFPAGPYALFTLSYDAAPPFSFDMDLKLPAGTKVYEKARLETPAHYSVMYNADYREWDEKPWLWHDDFYQTFTATGPYVTRIATKLAGKSGDHYWMNLNLAIYEINDGPPSTWKMISPVRSRYLSGGTDPIIHIIWVPYRSSDMRLTPGKRYAVRFWRDPKSQCETFALVVRPDKGGGYAAGQLYAGDKPRPDLDAYAFVSGGAPGTIVNHAPVTDMEDLKDLVGAGKTYGQTFKASGSSLAAVDVIYTTGTTNPDPLPFTFQVYDRPGGKPIGPARLTHGLPLVFQGRAAVIWKRGEVPLTPGQVYYIEWKTPGCNTWPMHDDLPGVAYIDGVAKPSADLAMSIAEYEEASATSKPGRHSGE